MNLERLWIWPDVYKAVEIEEWKNILIIIETQLISSVFNWTSIDMIKLTEKHM